ncbi:hypothetical protein P3T43_003952 [Paraburkholderia sp. GAS41]|jgi:hypothetical protein
MRETPLQFKRWIFTFAFIFCAMFCVHPLIVHYSSMGITGFY